MKGSANSIQAIKGLASVMSPISELFLAQHFLETDSQFEVSIEEVSGNEI